jgi:4-hydroxybenzoate polyprenyltransferase
MRRIQDFLELVMFQHTIFSLPFIFIAMIVASYLKSGLGWFGWDLLVLGVMATLTARNFAMGVNRYGDRDIDGLNPRTQNRPSVDGRISDRAMVFFILLNAFAFIAIAYLINPLAFKLSVPILIILGGYTLFKRFSSLAHLILGVSLALAPIAGVVAVLGEIPLWSIYLAVGVMFWVAGFDLLYSLQDMEFDKAHKLHSIPSTLGAKRTMQLSALFHLFTIFFWSAFMVEATLGVWVLVAIVLSALMLGYEHYLVRKDFTKIDRAFFTVNGYLGFIFLFFVIVEVMV